MPTLTANDLKTWQISYNPYTDLFQMFNERVFKTPNNRLKEVKRGDATLLYLRNNNRPMLVQLNNAYTYLGDIDNMSKEDIIKTIIGYVKNHAR